MAVKKTKALFLDRDGVINVDHGYVYKPQDFDWMVGIFDLIKMANRNHYKVIVVSNQSGIGRGLYSENDVLELNDWMKGECAKRKVYIDAIYYCPHHPEHALPPYLKRCECRKPQIGMALQAQENFDIDLQNSIMVGDKLSDIQFAENAGIGTAFYLSKVVNVNQASDITNNASHASAAVSLRKEHMTLKTNVYEINSLTECLENFL